MGLFDIFKAKQRFKRPSVKSAGATLYPDKIVLETVDNIKDLYGITSAKVTVLNPDVDSKDLGQALRYHLGQSRDNVKKPPNIEARYKDYLEAAGFKNRREHHRNALHLIIHEKDLKISLGPTINGGPTGKNRGFVNTKGEPLTIDANVTDSELGDHIRLGWNMCVCNYK